MLMNYSCTHMATVGVKGLILIIRASRRRQYVCTFTA